MDETSPSLADKIKNYNPPEAAEILVRETRLLLIAGPAGSGKDTIIKHLIASGEYEYIISHTTRHPRDGEENAKDYYFVDLPTAESMVDEQRFLEVRVVYDDHLFGTSMAEIQRVHDSGKIGVTDIDVAGADKYVKLSNNVKTVFVLPPSYDEWVHRLASRGSGEDADAIKRRLEDAHRWLEQALKSGHFYFVINSDLDKAVADVREFAEDPNFEAAKDETKVEHAWHVLGELKRNLNT